MKAKLSREDLLEGGFKEVWLYTTPEDKKEMEFVCFDRRLLIGKTFIGEEGMDCLLYEKLDNKKPLVIKSYIGDFETFKLLQRGFDIRYFDGSDISRMMEMVRRETKWRTEIANRGKEKKKLDGQFVGSVAPYGYYALKKKLYVDTYESFIVKFVFYRTTQGCDKKGIAKELNLRGFKTRQDGKFNSENIDNILKQKRFYQGFYEYKGVEVKGRYAPILRENDRLLTEEFRDKIFDEETEARISRNRKVLTKEEKNDIIRGV